jgi:hypothetical protein
MGQGQQTAKRHSKFEYQELAEQMSELRALRELVRNAETKWLLKKEAQRRLLSHVRSRTKLRTLEFENDFGGCLRRLGSNSKIVDQFSRPKLLP